MTDQEVRHAIKGIISAAATGAAVYEWNVLSHDLAEWPGLFGIPRHGWIIKRAAVESTWKNATKERPIWTYDIWGFYAFRSGKEGDNSDDEFAVILDAVSGGFKAKPTLELAEVEKHELLQVISNTTIDCGEETLHLAQCRLKVHICC
jgi:hypothetical protein